MWTPYLSKILVVYGIFTRAVILREMRAAFLMHSLKPLFFGNNAKYTEKVDHNRPRESPLFFLILIHTRMFVNQTIDRGHTHTD